MALPLMYIANPSAWTAGNASSGTKGASHMPLEQHTSRNCMHHKRIITHLLLAKGSLQGLQGGLSRF